MKFPSPINDFQKEHVQLLCSSYQHWTGKPLLSGSHPETETAQLIFKAPFAVLSHDTAPNPILNYSNQVGLELFEMTWDEWTSMPSTETAEAMLREERAALMKRVTENGYIDDYSGTRISKTGKRFFIEQATVWNLIDESGVYRGQAATFSDWVLVK
jgi:hypothetical protein